MVDIKKLITGFLILASVTGSFAFVLSSLTPNQRQFKNIQTAKGTAGFQVKLPANVLVKAEAQGGNNLEITKFKDFAQTANSSNLTENLAQNLARELLQLNPSGPQDISGEQSLIVPGDEKVATAVKQSLAGFVAQGDYRGPNFDEKIKDGEIKTLASYGSDDVLKYMGAVNGILKKTVLSPEVNGLVEAEPGMESVSAMQLVSLRALNEIKSTPVPVVLASVHKQLITLLANQGKFINVVADAEKDPLKTLALTQTTQNKIEAVLQRDSQNLENELKKIDFQKISKEKDSGEKFAAMIRSVFGIETAEAFIFVPIDCLGPSCLHFQAASLVIQAKTSVTTWGNLLRRIMEWARKFATEVLKQKLVNTIQQKIVGWLQGKGSPLFVTTWTTLLTNAFRSAAGGAIGQITPTLCPSFSGLVSSQLRNIFRGASAVTGGTSLSGAFTTQCSLGQSVGSIQNFYNDFKSGGSWNGYAALFQQNNNPFGALIEAHDQTARVAAQAVKAKENKAIAGQGYVGTAVCDNGFSLTGDCPNGEEPHTTTPGSTASNISSHGTKAQIDRIVNAQDVFGLITGLASSYLTKLIDSGVSGLTSITSSSLDQSRITDSATTPTVTPTSNSSCDGLTEPALTTCLNNASQGIASSTAATSTIKLACDPASQTVAIGKSAALSASGGDGANYSWSSSGGSPPSGTGPSFETSYSTVGSETVTVSSGSESANCSVTVQ